MNKLMTISLLLIMLANIIYINNKIYAIKNNQINTRKEISNIEEKITVLTKKINKNRRKK